MQNNLKNKTQLFINPASGRGKGKKYASMIQNFLHENGLIAKTSFSQAPGELVSMIKQACLDGCKTVLIAGGDGSIHEAVNGIMQATEIKQGNIKHPTSTQLGIIPVGTGNDFIKAANIPNDWRQACELLLNSSTQHVDIARISTKNGHKYFANGIGSGFDASIGITAGKIPLLRGKLIYVAGIIWHLLKGIPNPTLEITADKYEKKLASTLIAVSNGTCYGGSFMITPHANISDGLLDAVIAPPVGRLGAIPLLIQLIRGTHLTNKKVTYLRCKKFHLKSDIPIPVIADGEIIDEHCLEYSVELMEQKLSLLA